MSGTDALRLVPVALVLLGVLAAWRVRRRADAYVPPVRALASGDVPVPLTAPLTVVYFTSRLCGACRETPGVVRAAAPGVPAVPVDVSERPDLARKLALTETPTLLLVDARGRIRYAHVGNPAPAELAARVRAARDSGGMGGHASSVTA